MTGDLRKLRNQLSITERAMNARILQSLRDTAIKPEADESSSKRDVSQKQWTRPQPLRDLLKGLQGRETEPELRKLRAAIGQFV